MMKMEKMGRSELDIPMGEWEDLSDLEFLAPVVPKNRNQVNNRGEMRGREEDFEVKKAGENTKIGTAAGAAAGLAIGAGFFTGVAPVGVAVATAAGALIAHNKLKKEEDKVVREKYFQEERVDPIKMMEEDLKKPR